MKADQELIDYIEYLVEEAGDKMGSYKPNSDQSPLRTLYRGRRSAFEEVLDIMRNCDGGQG